MDRKLLVFYRYFNYRAESTRLQEELARIRTENLQVSIGSKYFGSKKSDLKGTGPNPTGRSGHPYLVWSFWFCTKQKI